VAHFDTCMLFRFSAHRQNMVCTKIPRMVVNRAKITPFPSEKIRSEKQEGKKFLVLVGMTLRSLSFLHARRFWVVGGCASPKVTHKSVRVLFKKGSHFVQ
jgi:hypothetical protein